MIKKTAKKVYFTDDVVFEELYVVSYRWYCFSGKLSVLQNYENKVDNWERSVEIECSRYPLDKIDL